MKKTVSDLRSALKSLGVEMSFTDCAEALVRAGICERLNNGVCLRSDAALVRLTENVERVVSQAQREAESVPARTVFDNGLPDGPTSAARMLHAAYARGVAASFAATLWQAREALELDR